MRRYIDILALAACAALATCCIPIQEVNDLSVTLDGNSVTLAYGATETLAFTASDCDGALQVTAGGLPQGVALSSTFDMASGTGELSFTSSLDGDSRSEVTLAFADRRTRVEKTVTVTTSARPAEREQLSVSVSAESVTLGLSEPAALTFTARGFAGDVAASIPSSESEVRLESSFDAASGNGVLAFHATGDRDLDKTVIVEFTDGEGSVSKEIGIIQHKEPEAEQAPSSVTLSPDSCVLYPEGTGHTLSVRYAVECASDFELEVECAGGVSARLAEGADRRTGTIEITAGAGFGDAATVSLTAFNGAGGKTGSLRVEKGYLNIGTDHCTVPSTGGSVKVKVSANIGCECRIVDNPGDMVAVSRSGNEFTVAVSENPEWEAREARLSFADERGYITRTLTVAQDPTSGTPESDKVALMNIYHALNGPNWKESGGVGDRLYSSWGSEDIRNWNGVQFFYSGTKKDRAWELGFVGFDDNRRGTMPDDLGHLTTLQLLRIDKSQVTGLPDNLGNLKDMKELDISQNPLNLRLDTHKGLEGLVRNARRLKWFCLQNCGIYGSVPEWLGEMYGGETKNDGGIVICLECNYLSGQVPDAVAKVAGWNRINYVDLDRDGWREEVTSGELAMRMQGGDGSYALWVGEKPDNVRFVSDPRGGHWEWIGENPYRDNTRYRKAYEQGPDETYGDDFYNYWGVY